MKNIRFTLALESYRFWNIVDKELLTSLGGGGDAPPETGAFLRLQVWERVGILLVEVYEREGKSVICVRLMAL